MDKGFGPTIIINVVGYVIGGFFRRGIGTTDGNPDAGIGKHLDVILAVS
jgi:hypothetical protein